ncbi:MAG TPA: HIT domain-containing protein [Solirubrobacterales bacterium]|jgi:diadenosine tetraphosphate (Ap4A) HIT family hydrolase|nr:HIT domain-containing protein [Solirubrobacterales bacterium]
MPQLLDNPVSSPRLARHACRFCDHLEAGTSESLNWRVVAETDRLVAVPSVGALVPGWLLLIPKTHALNLAEFAAGTWATLEHEIETIARRWEAVFGPLTWFEHGPVRPGTPTGCSIDHAHLHLVPLGSMDLLQPTKAQFPELSIAKVENFCTSLRTVVDSDFPYLYLRTPDAKSWLAMDSRIPSQAFRAVIANEQGRPDEYDWKRFPQRSVTQKTIDIALAVP